MADRHQPSTSRRAPVRPWRQTKSRYVLEDPWLKVRADDCETADGHRIAPYYVLEYPDWAHVFAIDDQRRVLVVDQYRHGMGVVCTELPGGTVDPGEDAAKAVRRELLEETGCTVEQIDSLGVFSPNPATHTNRVHPFVATGAQWTQPAADDPREHIRHHFISIDELLERIDGGKFQQYFHVSTVFMALRKLGLFKGAYAP